MHTPINSRGQKTPNSQLSCQFTLKWERKTRLNNQNSTEEYVSLEIRVCLQDSLVRRRPSRGRGILVGFVILTLTLEQHDRSDARHYQCTLASRRHHYCQQSTLTVFTAELRASVCWRGGGAGGDGGEVCRGVSQPPTHYAALAIMYRQQSHPVSLFLPPRYPRDKRSIETVLQAR